MMFRMGTVMTTVGGYPDEIKWLQKLLTFQRMSVEEAFQLQRMPGQVIVHRGGETATFTHYNKIVNAFPTGLVPYVQSYYPHPIEVWDETGSRYCDGLDRLSPTILDGVELRGYQLDAAHIALSRRRGVIQHPTGCHAKGQRILMYDGTIKSVEDVRVDDRLMGPDNKPRKVRQLIRGNGSLYKIHPVKGTPFTVNEDHILTLVHTTERNGGVPSERGGNIVDVSVRDYLQWSACRKHTHKLLRVAVRFRLGRNRRLLLAPYLIGAILGDGGITEGQVPRITCDDIEIIHEIERLIPSSWAIDIKIDAHGGRTPTYQLTRTRRGKTLQPATNPITRMLRKYGLYGCSSGTKFIPHDYKISTYTNRLMLLAGLIDTDGHLHEHGYYEFLSKSPKLAEDITYVARSVGFAAYIKEKYVDGTVYYRVTISGSISLIPTLVPRKQAGPRKQIKDVCRTGFSIERVGQDDYFGFNITSDGRYLMDDFTVTHNSGKTEVAAAILKCLGPEEFPVLFLVNTRFLLEQAAERFQKRGIDNVCIYGGGSKDICQGITVATVQGIVKGIDEDCPKVSWLTENVRTLMVDEGHHAGANSFYKAGVYLQQARNRIGLTMQLEEMPGIFGPFDLHTVGVLGPVIHELSPPYLRRHGWQSNPVTFILPTHGENVVWSKWKPAYDDGIVRHVARNSVDILLAQAAYRANRKTLLFVWQKPHGLALLQSLNDEGVPAIFATGQSKVQYFRGNQLVQETWPFERIQQYVDEPGGKIVIGTSVIDEGADLPETDVLILSVGGKAFRRLRQRIGRGLRPKGGEHTVVFDHMDGHNAKLYEHAYMRQYVWQFDQMQHESLSALKAFAGFEMPEYRPCYKPPVLSTSLPPVPSMVPGFGISAPMGLG